MTQQKKWWLIRLTLLLILLTGAYFRLHQLTDLPIGLVNDEAVNGLDAYSIGENGSFPIFFSANNGREPLYIYLQAATMVFLGKNAWSMRLTSAYIGILTLPILYIFAHEFTLTHKRHAVFIGLLSTALLAVSFWHISLSRLGFRVILLPPLSMMSLFFFWRGWEYGDKRYNLLAGIALGISQYTYLAARLLPLLFAIFVSLQTINSLWVHRSRWTVLTVLRYHTKLHGVLIMAVTFILVVAPLGIYFVTHPQAIGARTDDVFILSTDVSVDDNISAFMENVVATGRLFVDQGDHNLRHNLPGKPALNTVELVGFLIGLLLALRSICQPRSQLLLLWLLILVLPTTLSIDAPHFLRAAGILPPMLLLTGSGLVWMWEKSLGQWVKLPFVSWIILPLTLLLIGGLLTYRDYFQRWATIPYLYDAFQTSELETAQFALHALETDELYLVPDLLYWRHPTLELFLNNTDVRPFNSNCLLHQPQPQHPLTYLIRTSSDADTLSTLQELYPDGQTETAVSHPINGRVFFHAFTIPLVNRQITGESLAQFEEIIQLRETSISRTDAEINITVEWLTLEPIQTDYTLFFHVYPVGEENTPPLAQIDIQPCLPTSQWQPGEILHETYSIPLPSALPTDMYTIALGWYEQSSSERLSLTTSIMPLSHNRHELTKYYRE